MAAITELVTKFSFVGNSSPLVKYTVSMTAAISAAAAFVTMTNADTAAMANLSEAVGLSAQQMQAYGAVAKSMGLEQDVVVDLVEEMNNKLGESFSLMAKGEKPLAAVSDAMGMLGMEIKDLEGLSPDEQFSKISKAIEEMPDAQKAASAADILFGGEANKFFSALKRQGKTLDEAKKKYEEFNSLSDEGTEGAKKQAAAMRSLALATSSIGREVAGVIGGDLSPTIDKVSKAISGAFKANRGWIVGGLEKTKDIVFAVAGAVERFTPLIIGLGAAFLGAQLYAIGLTGVLSALGGVMAVITSPITFFVTILAGAILIIDDLIVAVQGGNSVIDKYMQEWFGIDIKPALLKMVDGVKWMVAQIKEIGSVIVDAIVAPFKKAADTAMKDFQRIKDAISWAMEAGEAVAGFFGGNDNQAERFTGRTGGGMNFTQPSSPAIASAGATTNNSSSNSSVQQTNSITINAASPQDAMEIGDNLQTQLADAERLAQRGGR